MASANVLKEAKLNPITDEYEVGKQLGVFVFVCF